MHEKTSNRSMTNLFTDFMMANEILDRQKPHEFFPPPKKQLFHYTTPAGLKGIIENGCIWATHAQFLNDSTEGQHGKLLIRKILKDRTIWSDVKRACVQQVLKLFEEESEFVDVSQDVYIGCFCEDNDLLSLWRGYSNTSGYSIGFSFPEITGLKPINSNNTKTETIMFGKVIYDNARKQDKVVEIIEGILADMEPSIEAKALATYWRLTTFAYLFKDWHFHEEKEWRVICTVKQGAKDTSIKFRYNNETVIPYLEVNAGAISLPIKKIMTGPTVNYERAKLAITKLLAVTGFADISPLTFESDALCHTCIDIEQSKIPYVTTK